jgi:hypothetical protein
MMRLSNTVKNNWTRLGNTDQKYKAGTTARGLATLLRTKQVQQGEALQH